MRQVGPDPIVVRLSAFNPSAAARPANDPGHEVSPGVFMARGPRPPTELPPFPPPRRPSTVGLAVLVLGIVAGLAAVGSGWAAALVPVRWQAGASLAPALGIAVLALAGLLADRMGLRLGGGGGIGVVAGGTALGWALALGRRRLSARSA